MNKSMHSSLSKSKIVSEFEAKYLDSMVKEDFLRECSGRLVFKECFLSSKFLVRNKPKAVLVAYSLLHAILPLLIYLFDDLHFNPLSTEKIHSKYANPAFWFYIISLSIAVYLSYLMNGYFADIGTLDMQRKRI